MRIVELMDRVAIDLNGTPKDKKEALDLMIELMERSGRLRDKEGFAKQVYEREEEGTTGIGGGIAIPHGKGDSVTAPGLAAMVVRDGVEYDSLDGEPVRLLFLIAAPNTEDNIHLDVLSKLSMLLMNDEFAESLIRAQSVEEFLSIVDNADKMEKDVEERITQQPLHSDKRLILAVTSCPTGIAHTYMAAESLQKAATKAGCRIKVETRGSGGTKNELTEAEIAQAECIIVAADAKVPMERFHGKKLLERPVSDGIGRAKLLVEEALSGRAPVYSSQNLRDTDSPLGGGSGAHRVYTRLMNGVSHMLPFVVGGGILIALAFLIDGFSVDMNALSETERQSFGSITPVAAMLKSIGGVAFGFMLPVLAGFIGVAIGDRPALAPGFVGGMLAANGRSGFLGAIVAGFLAGYVMLLLRQLCERLPDALEKIAPVLIYPLLGILVVGLGMSLFTEPVMGAVNTALNNGLSSMGGISKLALGLLLGGMMAVDMGGPFNKAAYVFGTAAIAAGNYDIMAAVMIGGMTPPCAIALATILFNSRFTREERESGPVNFIMGLAFITEGAIPYAAADPIHVIPSCIAGSAVAGMLSMAFGCTLMAPHGGIFVFPVVGNALLYCVALAAGILVSALLLGIWKRKTD